MASRDQRSSESFFVSAFDGLLRDDFGLGREVVGFCKGFVPLESLLTVFGTRCDGTDDFGRIGGRVGAVLGLLVAGFALPGLSKVKIKNGKNF